jgi:hypothetical protein
MCSSDDSQLLHVLSFLVVYNHNYYSLYFPPHAAKVILERSGVFKCLETLGRKLPKQLIPTKG